MSDAVVDLRFQALWRFGLAITILNLLGHTVLGFEQAWAHPLVALATAYSLELALEFIDTRATGRAPRFLGGPRAILSFMLPAHITALAVAMLLYSNARLWPIVFAAAVAIGSKYILRVPGRRGSQHFLNPSNFGITLTLLLFTWVGIAPPYQFTENLVGWQDWLLPGLIVLTGSMLNIKLTKKHPLILGWLGGFVAQAGLRSLLFDKSFVAALLPMSGLAFVLFTFYMVTDPATTPFAPRAQVAFGLAVAATYGLLMMLHVVFGLFFALTIVSCVRGLSIALQAWAAQWAQRRTPLPEPAGFVALPDREVRTPWGPRRVFWWN